MDEISVTQLDSLAQDFLALSETYTGNAPPDPYPILADLRRQMPVMPGDILARYHVPSQADYANSGRPVMTVFRYADVLAILRDPVTWKSYILADGFGASVENLLLTAMDGADHKRFRALFSPPFAVTAIQRMQTALMRPLIRDEFADKLRPRGKADLVRDFSLPFPVRVVYALFGFPDDNAAVMQFAAWVLQILNGPQIDPARIAVTGPTAMRAAQALYDRVLAIVQWERAAGRVGDNLLGFMLSAELDGQSFTDAQIASFLRMLLLAATETTSRSFANMMVMLFANRDTLERLRGDRTLLGKAVSESMRLDPTATNLARIATRDLTVSGVVIPEGTAVTLSIGAANRDPETYENPDAFWINRPNRPALSFGFGPHMCLGMHIARLEMEEALNALLDFPNLRLDPDYPPPVIRGLQMRGPDAVHAVWDS
jgi:cytochrome P450